MWNRDQHHDEPRCQKLPDAAASEPGDGSASAPPMQDAFDRFRFQIAALAERRHREACETGYRGKVGRGDETLRR